MLPLAACLALCAGLEMRLTEAGTFEALGLPPAVLQRLSGLAKDAPGWAEALSVSAGDPSRPAMLGTYSIANGVLRFTPRFPLKPGTPYAATVRAGTGETPFTASFTLPGKKRGPSAFVTEVYPTSSRLPENQLKFYIHFSAPMRQGKSYSHIRLLDDKGKGVDLPFLELDEELWDPEGKRFTLFIDPGRIKRSLKPREEAGPALEQGKRDTLAIEKTWLDADGAPLREAFEKPFTVGPPDEVPPEPGEWVIKAEGGDSSLRVDFGKPMDHALALRLVWVEDAAGKKVAGAAEMESAESVWVFTPEDDWKAGEYRLVVGTLLEDLAGNSVGRPFEVDLQRPGGKGGTAEEVRIPFRQPMGLSRFLANYLLRAIALDLYVIVAFALAVILARAFFWPSRPTPGGRMPLAAVAVIFAGAIAAPVSYRHALQWWEWMGPLRQADIMTICHYGIVILAVVVQALVIAGWPLGWRWVRNFWLRLLHLLAIVIVAGQPVNGFECPLTTWERDLRGGDLANLDGSWAIARMCNRLNFQRVESLTPYLIVYVVFAVLVMASWVLVRPEISGGKGPPGPAEAPPLPQSSPLPHSPGAVGLEITRR